MTVVFGFFLEKMQLIIFEIIEIPMAVIIMYDSIKKPPSEMLNHPSLHFNKRSLIFNLSNAVYPIHSVNLSSASRARHFARLTKSSVTPFLK